jgi:hypothetical protein
MLPAICFRGWLHYRAAAVPLAREIDRSDPSQDGNRRAACTLRTIFPHRKLECVRVRLEMCSISICFQLFPSLAVSPRLSDLGVTCHSLVLLLPLLPPAAADQFHQYPQADSYTSQVWGSKAKSETPVFEWIRQWHCRCR